MTDPDVAAHLAEHPRRDQWIALLSRCRPAPAEVTLSAVEDVPGDPDLFAAVQIGAEIGSAANRAQYALVESPEWDLDSTLERPSAGTAYLEPSTGAWVAVRTGERMILRALSRAELAGTAPPRFGGSPTDLVRGPSADGGVSARMLDRSELERRAAAYDREARTGHWPYVAGYPLVVVGGLALVSSLDLRGLPAALVFIAGSIVYLGALLARIRALSRRDRRMGLSCPVCEGSLVGYAGRVPALRTGRCSVCGAHIVDMAS